MTRRTTARIAGAAFIVYIAAGLTDMTLSGRATAGADIAARLASIGQHAMDFRIGLLLACITAVCAITLAATLYGLTRDADREMAALGLAGRTIEAAFNGIALTGSAALLWLGTTGATSLDATTAGTIATGIFRVGANNGTVGAWFFSLGSTGFCTAFLRGRMIPRWLAVLGLVTSVLLVIALPLRLSGFASATVINVLWAPMAVFELVLAVWLIVKGVAEPIPHS